MKCQDDLRSVAALPWPDDLGSHTIRRGHGLIQDKQE
jgi:hypothetical protein